MKTNRNKTKKSGKNLTTAVALSTNLTEEKKSVGSRLFKQFEQACMSAPGKAQPSVESDYLRISVNEKVNCENQKDAPSRFSSCTAKTSPSTDNNSVGGTPNENGRISGGGWELALNANIRKQSKGKRENSDEPMTPTRIRACSDTTPSNLMTKGEGDCSTPPSSSNTRKNPNHLIMDVGMSARASQKAGNAVRSKFIEHAVMAGPVKTVVKTRAQ